MKLTVNHLKKHPEKIASFEGAVRIWSGQRQAWWRQNACGYTDDINKAGEFSFKEAWTKTRFAGKEKKIEIHSV